jgi:DNA-directed RNA polymerase specialized sigma subunit
MLQIDGYKSPQQWYDTHRGAIPSDYLHMYYHEEYNDSITSYPKYSKEYTPRPSFLKKFKELKFDSIIEGAGLTEMEMKMLRMLYVDNMTQQETSEALNCSQGWVSILRAGVINKIKKKLN